MENNNQTQWSEVKKIKFHHRVKRFYYKNLFRKIYTVVIIGLIAANIFSWVKYASFADELPMQTNTGTEITTEATLSPVGGLSGDVQVNSGDELSNSLNIQINSGDVLSNSGDMQDNPETVLTGGDQNDTQTNVEDLPTGIDNNTLASLTTSSTVTITKNTTLNAEDNAEIYTITYNLNGGIELVTNPTKYTVESGDILLNRPSRTGYMFMGWTGSNGNTANPDATILSGSQGDKTYNAVWLPFYDLNIYTLSNTGNITHHTIMDRNMGATSTNIVSSDSYGSYYKWGNNQGYAKNTSSWTSIPVGIWTKGEQGPCPYGYHVPEKSDLVGLGFDWARAMGVTPPASEIDVLFQNNTLFDLIKHDFLASMGGGKAYSNGTLYGIESYVSWHSSESYDQSNDYIFWFTQETSSHYFKVGRTNKNSGYPVRCFKNSPISRDLTIYPNGGTGAVIVFTGEVGNGKIITLGTPKRANSVFEGWYSNAELATSVTTGSTAPANLYAKWSCDTGYEISGDACVTTEYTITYNLNGGTETTANPTLYTIESGAITLAQLTKTGYTFLGWTGSNGNVAQTNVTIPVGSYGNKTYNAVWTANTYTVKFDAGEGTGTMVNQNFTYDAVQNLTANSFTRTGFTFSGWTDGSTGYKEGQEVINLTTTNEATVVLTAEWTPIEYKLAIYVNGIRTVITGYYGDQIIKPANPIKNGYRFIGWEPEIPATMPAEDVEVKATWERLGSSGGGGRKSSTDSDNQHGSAEGLGLDSKNITWNKINSGNDVSDGQLDIEKYDLIYSLEMNQAYQFAYTNGITTMNTIKKADMDGKLTRIQMAKMLSYYAINVLGQKPDLTKGTHKFVDVSVGLDDKYDNGVSLAYNLGIMGINMQNNKFRPNSYVTRAEFTTALSRMIYGIKDGTGKTKYYEPHMNKLKKEGIITNTNPNMKELRGYVMLMLMRSAK